VIADEERAWMDKEEVKNAAALALMRSFIPIDIFKKSVKDMCDAVRAAGGNYIFIYVFIHIFIYIFIHIFICIFLCIHLYIYIHIYLYIHIYMYICMVRLANHRASQRAQSQQITAVVSYGHSRHSIRKLSHGR
jgi:hypothetical protein